jgi:hypothetical protein
MNCSTIGLVELPHGAGVGWARRTTGRAAADRSRDRLFEEAGIGHVDPLDAEPASDPQGCYPARRRWSPASSRIGSYHFQEVSPHDSI